MRQSFPQLFFQLACLVAQSTSSFNSGSYTKAATYKLLFYELIEQLVSFFFSSTPNHFHKDDDQRSTTSTLCKAPNLFQIEYLDLQTHPQRSYLEATKKSSSQNKKTRNFQKTCCLPSAIFRYLPKVRWIFSCHVRTTVAYFKQVFPILLWEKKGFEFEFE